MNGTFNPLYSSNIIYRDDDDTRCLTSDLEAIESNITTLENGKANVSHTHANYAETNHVHSDYASSDHEHSNYASIAHTHSAYALNSDIVELQNLVGDTAVSTQINTAISGKADVNHTHTQYTTMSDINSAVASKANTDHTHNISDITSGTLSIMQGGTGATTAAGILNNLGIADYVTERGTSGIWTYEKWDSGKAVCWCTVVPHTAITTSIGSVYYTSAYSYSFPTGLFYAAPKVFINCNVLGAQWASAMDITKNQFSLRVLYPFEYTNVIDWPTDVYVVGRWK